MTSIALDEVLARLQRLPPEEIAQIRELRLADKAPWFANAGPQLEAELTPADILLYGGQGGGGKTQLLLGLALTKHKRSLILRRRYVDLGAITDEAIKINGTRDGYNGSSPPKLRTRDGRLIEFGACNTIGEEQGWQGQPHDFLGIDETSQFAESQVRFLMGWVRTTEEGQRTRVVLATNPPLSSEGSWLVPMFRPWLDPSHPKPAKCGELRWFITDADGKDLEVDGPEPKEIKGEIYRPLSRTFIRASVDDNPFLRNTGYLAQLDALKEPWRSAVRDGNFMAVRADHPFQVIPSEWVREAQSRWTPRPPADVPMIALALDVAQGGADDTVIAARHDAWYAPLVVVPGKETPRPSDAAALVVKHRRNGAAVVVDVGGGYGGGVIERLKENGIPAQPFNGAGSGLGRTKDRVQGFCNARACAWWRFREALDPEQDGGSPVALPPDPVLADELACPAFEINARGILIEAKEKVKERIGRSPDRADAVVMAWAEGQRVIRRNLADDGGRHGGSLQMGSGRQKFAITSYGRLKQRSRTRRNGREE